MVFCSPASESFYLSFFVYYWRDQIEKSLVLISKMKRYDEIDLDEMFFGNPHGIDRFIKLLTRFLLILKM